MFPDVNTPNMLFGAVKFSEVPICHIKSSSNNTILQVTKANGKLEVLHIFLNVLIFQCEIHFKIFFI